MENILKDNLRMCHICIKFVPYILTKKQMKKGMWSFAYDPEKKLESSE